ncbi:MAG: SOS response-associated peptidase family protein [Bacteroidota bacterium]
MCFTVNVNIVKEELEKRFNTSFIDHENYRPSYYYNAHALPELPVVGYFDNEYNIRLMKWGLIPGWLDGDTGHEDLNTVLEPYPDESLKAHTISPLINNSRINRNTPQVVEPYTYPDQSTLF